MAENFEHPAVALFAGSNPFPTIPSCEHIAGSERFAEKAFGLQSEFSGRFDVTLDLEDGAPLGGEMRQLELILDLLRTREDGAHRCGVRVHDSASPYFVREVSVILRKAGSKLAYLTIPKVVSYADAERSVRFIAREAAIHGIAAPRVHLLIETPLALHEVWRIAALPLVEVLDFGLLDFISGHHGAISERAMHSPEQFEHPLIRRAKCDIAAAALGNGVVPSHNVSLFLNDAGAVFRDARRARDEFGFLRMWSIHPSHIEPILRAFAPDSAELERSAVLLEQAAEKQWGPVRFEDRLFDRASYRLHWILLSRARAMQLPIPERAQRWFL